MRILFVHCNLHTNNGPHFVPGLGALSAVLKQAGHETRLIFLQEDLAQEAYQARVREIGPGLVGFSTLTNQWPQIRQYVRWTREACAAPVILGGPHVTMDPERSLACPEIDLICVGDGEGPMLDLVGRLEAGRGFEDIPNLWTRDENGTVHKTPLRPLVEDLDTFPIPDRELFDLPWLLRENPVDANLMMAGRGCPYRCKYCGNNHFNELYKGHGRYVRWRSPGHVLAEIRKLCSLHAVDRLLFVDDTFTHRPKWTEDFCRAYAAEFKMPFTVQVRVDTVNPERLRLLRDAGCDQIIVGVESGSERVRREIMGRPMTNDQIIAVFEAADALGLRTRANFMLGLPTETTEELEESLALNRRLNPHYTQVAVFYPLPGTELYAFCEARGFLQEKDGSSMYTGHSILRLDTLTPEQIKDAYQRMKAETAAMAAAKEARGIYDFLARFSEAERKADEPGHLVLTSATLFGDERIAVFAHPESRLSYTLDIPASARLKFQMALSPEVWSPEKGGGVYFEVHLQDGDWTQILFSRYLDPKHREQDRCWLGAEVRLPAFASGGQRLHFITTTKGGSRDFAWALWSRVYLETAPA